MLRVDSQPNVHFGVQCLWAVYLLPLGDRSSLHSPARQSAPLAGRCPHAAEPSRREESASAASHLLRISAQFTHEKKTKITCRTMCLSCGSLRGARIFYGTSVRAHERSLRYVLVHQSLLVTWYQCLRKLHRAKFIEAKSWRYFAYSWQSACS